MLILLQLLLHANAATVSGHVSFEADYKNSDSPRESIAVGQVPSGHSDLPLLYLCAWKKVGALDFKTTDYPNQFISPTNDVKLGCARADDDGDYSIDFDMPTGASWPVYLSTWLCDEEHKGSGTDSPAEVCVRLNAEQGSFALPQNTKVIWSWGQYVSSGSTTMDWNLSCPDVDPNDSSSTCTPEPDSMVATQECACDDSDPWKDCGVTQTATECATLGNCGDTNSRTGCNKEAVHAFRAAVEPVRTSSLRPTDSNTYNRGVKEAKLYDPSKPDSKNTGPIVDNDDSDGVVSTYCDAEPCQDEVQIRLFYATRDSAAVAANCTLGGGGSGNASNSFYETCIQTPLNPFRVVHEIGHCVEKRWKADATPATDNEHKQVREGWANVFGAAAWFDDDDPNPEYCGSVSCWDLEANSCESTTTNPYHERDFTRLLWDLYDDSNAIGESDREDWRLADIKLAMSDFHSGVDKTLPGGATNPLHRETEGGSRELSSNALDFAYWWNESFDVTVSGSDFCTLAQDMCLLPPSQGGVLDDSLRSGIYDDFCP